MIEIYTKNKTPSIKGNELINKNKKKKIHKIINEDNFHISDKELIDRNMTNTPLHKIYTCPKMTKKRVKINYDNFIFLFFYRLSKFNIFDILFFYIKTPSLDKYFFK
jgi:hypothetical protein